jgi:hypothetical protein
MKKLGWKIILAVVIVAVAVILLKPPAVQMTTPSPSHRKAAVLKTGPPRFLADISRLYITETGNKDQFIGMVLNNEIDRVVGMIWSPDETKLAIANNYDGCPCMIVIVDLNDSSGKVAVPAHYGFSDTGITTNEVSHIIKTRYSIRSAVPSDLKWLAPELSGMQCEHGNFLEHVQRLLHADKEGAVHAGLESPVSLNNSKSGSD